MDSYGVNLNMAFTSDADGKCSVGIHITDSEGMDVSHDGEGTDELKVITDVLGSVSKDLNTINKAKKLKEEQAAAKAREEKQAKLKALREKAAALQKELDEVQQKISDASPQPVAGKPIKAHTSTSSLFDEFAQAEKILGKLLR